MSFKCELFTESFTRTNNLERHTGRKHVKDVPKTHEDSMGGEGREFVFKHPFTMILAGPTCSGKTKWVSKLIMYAQQIIYPVPRRRIFFYSQWQPLYIEMQQAVKGIEFVRNIPSNLDSDNFLDPGVPSLVLIADLMTDATKNESVCNLFVRGSHHRNVSVICLLQNLFYHGKENRTMSLNAHYLVLFKKPRDQQQINVLAKQMFHTRPRLLMDKYSTYTERNFGYILIDLKPDTPESDRLLTNVFPVERQEQQIHPLGLTWKKPLDNIEDTEVYKSNTEESQKSLNMAEKPGSSDHQRFLLENKGYMCNECGVVIANMYDLQRHIKEWCPEDSQKRRRDWRWRIAATKMNQFQKRKKVEKEEDNDQALFDLASRVQEETESEWSDLVNKLEEEMSADESKDEADKRLLPKYRKKYIEILTHYIRTLYWLKKSALFRRIIEDTEDTVEDEKCDYPEALKMVLRKRNYAFDIFLEATGQEDESDMESISEKD